MKKRFYFFLALIFIGLALFYRGNQNSKVNLNFNFSTLSEKDTAFSLQRGDILVRPNMTWLPGSCKIIGGRMYGHVAVVTSGATGKTIGEVLSKSQVVEALFFNQATRKLELNRKNQIREVSAAISFGTRFKGIRYRLRTPLSESQADSLILFLRNQLDGHYNLLSLKIEANDENQRRQLFEKLKNRNWHCATIVWEAFHLAVHLDIDASNGVFIYPSDMIPCSCFDGKDGRLRF